MTGYALLSVIPSLHVQPLYQSLHKQTQPLFDVSFLYMLSHTVKTIISNMAAIEVVRFVT